MADVAWKMRSAAVALVVGLGMCIAASPASSAAASSPDTRACGSMESFPAGTAGQILSGKLTIAPFAAATIGTGTINWSMNPFNDPTWRLYFLWGEWTEALIEGYLAGGPHASAYRARAESILQSWITHVPIADMNPLTAICAAQVFPGQGWIHDEIPVLLDYYAAHWQGAYNHGISQDLELLAAGCAYPATEWGGKPLTWRKTALAQMIASFEPNQYGPALDADGVSNEQATGYANLDLGLWTEAEASLHACGMALPAWITERIAKMPLFLALATQPDGRLVQIGDTYQITARHPSGTPLEFATSRGDLRRPVVLLAAVRTGNPDPRPRRPHGPHLLRARQEPHRQRGPRRLRSDALPDVPAVTGGEQCPRHARGQFQSLRRDPARLLRYQYDESVL
jgi:hypothetical protein